MNNIETVRTLIAALQSGDMDLAANLLSADFALIGFAPRTLNQGQFLALHSELLAAMPDLSYNLDDIQQEADAVHAQITIIGTHQHDLSLPLFDLENVRATGIEIVLPQTPVTCHISDSSVTSISLDNVAGGGLFGILQQIGSELPLQPRGRNIAD